MIINLLIVVTSFIIVMYCIYTFIASLENVQLGDLTGRSMWKKTNCGNVLMVEYYDHELGVSFRNATKEDINKLKKLKYIK